MKVKPLFQNLLFVLDLGSTSYKEKQTLREQITNNGGTISYILTKTSNYVIVPDVKRSTKVDTYKSRKAETLQIPVLFCDFVNKCVEVGHIVDTDPYCATGLTKIDQFKKGKIQVEGWNKSLKAKSNKKKVSATRVKTLASKRFSTQSSDCPGFAEHFHIGKFVFLQGSKELKNSAVEISACVFELHIAASENNIVNSSSVKEHGFRILEQTCTFAKDAENLLQKHCYEYFFTSCKEAALTMQYLIDERKSKDGLSVVKRMPSASLGSFKLRHMVEEMGISSGFLPAQVARLVFSVSTIAFGDLFQNLSVDASSITPDQITKAVVLLMRIKDYLKENKPTDELSLQFNSVLSLKNSGETISDMKALSKQQDFVQLLKDVMLIFEVQPQIKSLVKSADSMQMVAALYKMLKCSITFLTPEEEDHELVRKLLCGSNSNSLPSGMKIRNIYAVRRDVENTQFSYCVTPTKLLLHASDPKNFVGILSRGLLLPLVVVSEHGTERSDVGMLGNGIYFSDDIRKAIIYSKSSSVSGSRFLLVNEVALGHCHDYTNFTPSLLCPPKGFNSVCGVASRPDAPSDFDFNEYVIFNVEQQRIKYLVEFTLKEDSFVATDKIGPTPISDLRDEAGSLADTDPEKVTLNDLKKASSEVKSGLVIKSRGQDKQLPLQEVHIRAKMMDMVAEVVVMQVYTNNTNSALEAKYVFPLDDSVAVCGFEAFINGKHVVGKVKEKEVAHKEYKAAVDAGHGAYLMDQEKPNVFTVSVGNLPVKARVVIKITYVSELPVIPADDKSSDSVLFFIPGSLAAAAKREVLVAGPITQTKVDRITASGANLKSTSLIVTVEMPFDIRKLESPTHKVFVKRTAAKACVRLAKNNPIGGSGFKLLVTMAEIHVPRMWVEQHPDSKESQACMLAFYPEFDAEPVLDYKAIILLDMSMSMQGNASENLEKSAKKLALMILNKLPSTCLVNVVKFGSGYDELFVFEQTVGDNIVKTKAEEFIQACSASCGSSDAWRPLTSINALQQSSDDETITNVFLLSDGLLSEENRLLQLSRSLGESFAGGFSRVFTFSLGNSANQHLLRSLSFASGGAHEHFSNDSKSKWENKVENQLKKAEQPMLKDIKIQWKQYDDEFGSENEGRPSFPIQAPENVKCLFNASRLVVYGFIPHCTQAELFATVCGKEISTVVSTTQLSITNGKTLHRLTARAMIKDYEEGMHDVDPLVREQLKTERKPHIVELSCLHDVVSPYTSFVAVEEREKDENLSSNDGPTVTELVNAAFVDVIPEIAWDEEALFEEMSDLERIKKEIEAANVSYYSSAMQSNRHFEEAEKIIKKLSGVELKEAQVCLAATKTELNMVAEFPVIDVAFGEYLVKVLEKEDTLNSFLSFAQKSDISQWNKCTLSSRQLVDVAKKLNEPIQKSGIVPGDQRPKDMLKWLFSIARDKQLSKKSMQSRRKGKFSNYDMEEPMLCQEIGGEAPLRGVETATCSANANLLRQRTILKERMMDVKLRRKGLLMSAEPLQSEEQPSSLFGLREKSLFSPRRSLCRPLSRRSQPQALSLAPTSQLALASRSNDSEVDVDMQSANEEIIHIEKNMPSPQQQQPPPVMAKSISKKPESLKKASKKTVVRKKATDVASLSSLNAAPSTIRPVLNQKFSKDYHRQDHGFTVHETMDLNFASASLPQPVYDESLGLKDSNREQPLDFSTLESAATPMRSPLFRPWSSRHSKASLKSKPLIPSKADTTENVGYGSPPVVATEFAVPPVPPRDPVRRKIQYLCSDSVSLVPRSRGRPPIQSSLQARCQEEGVEFSALGSKDSNREQPLDFSTLESAASPMRSRRHRSRLACHSKPSLTSKPLILSKADATENVGYGSPPVVATEFAVPPVPPRDPVQRKIQLRNCSDGVSFAPRAHIQPPIIHSSPQARCQEEGVEFSEKSELVDSPMIHWNLPLKSLSSEPLIPSKADATENVGDDSLPVPPENAVPSVPPRDPVLLATSRRAATFSSVQQKKFTPSKHPPIQSSPQARRRGRIEYPDTLGLMDEENVYDDSNGDDDTYLDMSDQNMLELYEAGPLKATSRMHSAVLPVPLSGESGTESDDETKESATKQLEGFSFIFDLLGNYTCEQFNKAFLEYNPTEEGKVMTFMSSEKAAWQGLKYFSQVLAAFEDIIKLSGALSLGKQVYKALLSMLAIAFAIEFCQKYNDTSPMHCVNWLKMMDEQHPALYSRLEFGSSWSNAAIKIVDKLIAFIKDKPISIRGLKKEIEMEIDSD